MQPVFPRKSGDEKLAALVWRLHPPEVVDHLKARAAATTLSDEERSRALTALAFVQTPEAVKTMLDLSKNENKLVAEQATYWVSFRQGNTWYALWDWRKSGIDLEHERKVAAMKIRRKRILDEQMPLHEKKRNARQMAGDVVGAQMLFSMIEEQQLPPELYPFVEEQILRNEDAAVRMQATGYFRKNAEADYSAAEIATLKPDVSSGKILFERNCATCHRAKNAGSEIGPDLTAIKSKFDRKTLLDAIIHPDAGIVFGYEVWTINLRDGQSFFGFLLADGQQTVTLKDLTGKQHVIDKSEIRSRKKQEHSLMPPPASLGLTEQNLADVSEYLMKL